MAKQLDDSPEKDLLKRRLLEKGRRGLRDFLRGQFWDDIVERKLQAGVFCRLTLHIDVQDGQLTKAEVLENTTLKPNDFVSD